MNNDIDKYIINFYINIFISQKNNNKLIKKMKNRKKLKTSASSRFLDYVSIILNI